MHLSINNLCSYFRISLLALIFCISFQISRAFILTPEAYGLFLTYQLLILLLLIFLIRRPFQKPFKNSFIAPICTFVLVMLLSNFNNGHLLKLDFRVIVWLLLPLLLYLLCHLKDSEFTESITITLPIYLLLNFFFIENPNIFSASTIGLTILTLGHRYFWGTLIISLLLSCFFAYKLSCIGALLSVLIMIMISLIDRYKIKYKNYFIIILVLLYLLYLYIGNFSGYYIHFRDQLISEGFSRFLTAPFFGIGTGKSYLLWTPAENELGHTHLFPLTVLAEMGLIGFFTLSYFCVVLYRRWECLPDSSRMLIALFAAWSLVDEPVQWWGGAMLFCLALSREATTSRQ